MPEPLADLYDAHGLWLWRTARSWLGTDADADDAVQEVFLAVAAAGVADRIQAPRAYLAAALVRACARIGRRRRAGPGPLGDHDPAAPPGAAGPDEALDRALAGLPPEQRAVVALKVEADLTFAAVAEHLGINANTAASRWRLALDRLRTALGGDR
ncbi:MAG: hypothetical protein RLZZ127_2388 [Planctomycetota bacterium]|jgi:RNA polymerase sigma-70 factor (ECF subfamily)